MSWVTWLNWVIVVEYAALGIVWLYWLRERAAWRKLALHVLTQQPIVNLAPPTMIQVGTPDWCSWIDTDAPGEQP